MSAYAGAGLGPGLTNENVLALSRPASTCVFTEEQDVRAMTKAVRTERATIFMVLGLVLLIQNLSSCDHSFQLLHDAS